VRRRQRRRITENAVIRWRFWRRIDRVRSVGAVRASRAVLPKLGRPGGCCGGVRGGTVRRVESSGSLLAARLAAGDDRALAEALDEFGPAVHATALRILGDPMAAQDVVQDVFVEFWRHPERYNAALSGPRTYLTLCARHRAVDVVRSELRRAGREERHARGMPPPRQPSPGEQVADADTASAVRAAVRTLPPDQRRVVELAYFDGLSYRDVALRIGIPEGTAKSRVRLALAKLEGLLDRQLLESS
jgi:RNA polymerase sigma-70 factor (ECF subfamily)